MSRALLDVSTLLALLDQLHNSHRVAQAWADREIGQGWATCPITENGFIRIISQPQYSNRMTISEAFKLIRTARMNEHHDFWPDSISTTHPLHLNSDQIYGPSQLNDLYLLALAVANGGKLVTFDRSIPLSAVPGAGPEHLVVLS